MPIAEFTDRDFRKWLLSNVEHLKDYTAWEIADLARVCGFSVGIATHHLSEWLTRSQKQLRLYQSPFFEKWVRASLAQKGKDYI